MDPTPLIKASGAPVRRPRRPPVGWPRDRGAGRVPAALLAACLAAAGCKPEVRTIPFDDGSVFVESHWKGEFLDGEFRQFYPSGQLERRGVYRRGLPEGEWASWYENGQQETTEHYVNGVRHGTFVEWYATGDKRAEGAWVDGDRVGLWHHWSTTGEPGSDALWEEGTRVSVEYFD